MLLDLQPCTARYHIELQILESAEQRAIEVHTRPVSFQARLYLVAWAISLMALFAIFEAKGLALFAVISIAGYVLLSFLYQAIYYRVKFVIHIQMHYLQIAVLPSLIQISWPVLGEHIASMAALPRSQGKGYPSAI